ncbi:MAG: hypothetical protein JST15_02980 [Bacteroidetes bacterium]|nr:hypothetical protein [Bacteroidota bacterium]
MKRFFTSFFLFLSYILSLNVSSAQVQPTFNLTATNYQFTDSLGDGYDAMTFDIMILHTNLGQSGPYEFALGQYYFNFDGASGVNSTDYTYYMVPGTTTFTNTLAVPRNPTIVNPDATSPTGGSLRVNSNTVLGLGNGPIISTAYPGTRVSTFRLKKRIGNMPDFTNFILAGTSGYGTNTASAWRIALPGPFTKIFAYVGTLNTDISLQGTYTVDYNPNSTAVTLNNPSDNSIDNPTSINFNWKKNAASVNYVFQLFSDSLLSNNILTDTIHNNTDTFKTVNGLNLNTKYFWRVGGKNSNGVVTYSLAWKFTTTQGITLNLKIIPEGLYFSLFNQLARRDTFTVYLRNTASPYLKVDSAKAIVDSVNFTGSFTFSHAPAGTYYIAAKHFNTLETWSKAGGVAMLLNEVTFYDFTNAAAQAYGSNQKLKGSKYCAYSGDVNQDGITDASDLIRIYNDSYTGLTGSYLVSDLNGDNSVDVTDLGLIDNNVYNGIFTLRP